MPSPTSFELLSKIFLTVFPLVSIVLIGYLYARKRSPKMAVANTLNMDVFIPALLFSVLASKSFDLVEYGRLALAAFVVVIGSGILVYPVCKYFGWDVKTFVPPMMFNNAGNLGLPLAVLAFGEAALPAAVMLFLVENTLHFTLGLYLLDRNTRMSALAKMPVILASAAGIFWNLSGWPLPEFLALCIGMLGDIAIPLMLFALGVRMTNIDFGQWRIGMAGAVLCPLSGLLIAIPLVMTGLLTPVESGYLILFAALPPALLNFMIAEQYQYSPQQVSSIVLLGNFGSLLVIPVVLAFIL